MTIGVVSSHLLTFRGQRSQEGVRKWGKERQREERREVHLKEKKTGIIDE